MVLWGLARQDNGKSFGFWWFSVSWPCQALDQLIKLPPQISQLDRSNDCKSKDETNCSSGNWRGDYFSAATLTKIWQHYKMFSRLFPPSTRWYKIVPSKLYSELFRISTQYLQWTIFESFVRRVAVLQSNWASFPSQNRNCRAHQYSNCKPSQKFRQRLALDRSTVE